MTMTTTSAATRGMAIQGLMSDFADTLTRWWTAYMTHRLELAAMAQLESMSDRELKDIGVTRTEIMRAVRGEMVRGRAY
jgi:uncharacterized protein YjiS (DUF1127 family)